MAHSKSAKKPSRAARMVILFLSHVTDAGTLGEFRRIRHEAKGYADSSFLHHWTGQDLPRNSRGLPLWQFTEMQLRGLGYRWVGKHIVPGSAHFPLFGFFSAFPHYESYWMIEYDVRFTGNWSLLFGAFLSSPSDFLSCQIQDFAANPEWYWWPSLNHPQRHIPNEKRLRSFSPIYRISRPALIYLHECLRDGWCGHPEVLIPTLLSEKGFTISDFGGNGAFVAPGNRNRFYINGPRGTMRWRPSFAAAGRRKNKLYHPVKPKNSRVNKQALPDS
jgi:hypothetical protein